MTVDAVSQIATLAEFYHHVPRLIFKHWLSVFELYRKMPSGGSFLQGKSHIEPIFCSRYFFCITSERHYASEILPIKNSALELVCVFSLEAKTQTSA